MGRSAHQLKTEDNKGQPIGVLRTPRDVSECRQMPISSYPLVSTMELSQREPLWQHRRKWFSRWRLQWVPSPLECTMKALPLPQDVVDQIHLLGRSTLPHHAFHLPPHCVAPSQLLDMSSFLVHSLRPSFWQATLVLWNVFFCMLHLPLTSAVHFTVQHRA